GKALGALIGVLAAGPVGALFGTFIGHLFDVQAEGREGGAGQGAGLRGAADVQEAFFRATFVAMGHLAKADGRVSEDEIRAARAMMSEFRLGEREVERAIELFTQGKRSDFPLTETLQELRQLCRNRPDLCRMFVQIQLQTALWAGSLNAASREVLARICAAIGVSAYEVVQMEALLRMQQHARQPQAQPAVDRVAQAYEVLGVTRDASNGEVTKAYRRLMSQNHPDKLVAKGLPESMMKVAQEKTQQIRAAYEILRAARGMR
ncbi:MAG: co-chaperone DjlA, partial [Steroidobacteraceae bacterium]